MAKDSIIKVHNISFTYPETDSPAIDHVSFEIKRGSWTSIIGHNGSGKSTIIRLLNGLLVADENSDSAIEIDGTKLDDDSVWDIRDKIGVVFQNPDNQFVGATVADDVAFGLENRGVPRPEMLKIVPEAIEAVGMSEYANTEPANLSGGQKQRVAIAGILAIRPKIIVLDEATSMLDPEGRDKILSIVRQMKDEYDLTVLAITHDLDEANQADNVLVMNDGKLLTQGTTTEVFGQVKLLREIGLDVPFFQQVMDDLRSDSLKLPQKINSEKELVNYLCQLNSNK
ncbi:MULTISPECIES: energy-coupling factor ABC transporter ATP-binding protein [Lactobacillaceae]|uniref:energy-coupling factor ABC transporter ATP-binding protein n=1 Tax=Lactobacillaceae TaxID=33958 RepID=UPI00226A4721|nr:MULTISPECIES: energy-coupling factor ABC transporter ATP-binding protein [Lactobacillaceae]MCT6844615.1 energy-coupling factor ABC transporter ATP-binding protein [Bombilactobacillus mellifer]MCX8720601.1 energy-coupling factor ABC transporter ATP-binding protein [Lactobacillus sp. B4010]MCX8723308.1 energy-coupling factor ABC transporter ATP-binding protein [Lactobacillus sp. B4005]MCX8724548.1 energy-coupling factor ABC transporter ATP-binding protein [Lactobacillus sp. B4007]MCX8731376.1